MACLETTIQEKLQFTRELEHLEQQRESLVTGMGFANDNEGMSRCFSSLAGGDMLVDLWQQLLANTENARDNNLANGGILESSRQYAEQALRMLRGQSDNAAVYGPTGGAGADLGKPDLGEV